MSSDYHSSNVALENLPERFKSGPRSEVLDRYIKQKYSKYGHKVNNAIMYNPEFKPTELPFDSDRYRWMENVGNGLRFVGTADKIIRLDHKGWYIDNFQGETVHGEVYQLPARNGEPLYVPAVNDPFNDNSACVDFRSATNDKEDAARLADQMAEQWAEREREYQAKEDVKRRLEEIDQEIKDKYAQFRGISRAIRANCDKLQGVAVVRELVKDKWEATKETIRELRREQKRIEDHGIEY